MMLMYPSNTSVPYKQVNNYLREIESGPIELMGIPTTSYHQEAWRSLPGEVKIRKNQDF